jgi:hypothetical protein
MADVARDSDIVSKQEFAALVGVRPSCVSNWISRLQIGGDAIVGTGNRSRINVAVARKQLRSPRTPWRWEKPDRQANEILDATIYASAAAIKHGVNWISDQGWHKLEAQWEAPGPAPAPGDKRQTVFTTAKSIADKLAR